MDNLRKAMWDNGSLIILSLIGLAITIAGAVSLFAGPVSWKGVALIVVLAILIVFCLYACVAEVLASFRLEKSRPKTP